jgi:hypothetical protein
MKFIHYNAVYSNTYFWRTSQKQEIDYIEERGGKLHVYEFKWKPGKFRKFPETFTQAYPGSEFLSIDNLNFNDFLGV